jgi:chlorobactene glucosyltransferase
LTDTQWAVLLCGAWTLFHVIVVVRFMSSRSLDEHSAEPPADAPLVSVIVPARNEARNIGRCVRHLLGAKYPNFEVIVVDDHSTDGTGDIVRAIGKEDGRGLVRVLDAPPLPEGWFGKQWACQSGAAEARGSLLLFTDADTAHGPALLARSVNALRARGSALFTVAGKQEMVTFWEKVIQPFVFAILMSRYGSLEAMARTRNPRNAIANGQFLLFTRAAYDALGKHEVVRAHVAEDMMLAQMCVRAGLPAHMELGRDHLSTRMYTSLGEIRRGWGKNLWAAGRDSLPGGEALQPLFRVIFPLPALVALLPTVVLNAVLVGGAAPSVVTAAWIAQAVTMLYWIGVYTFSRLAPWWALTYPLAAVVFAWMLGEAAWRGARVEWKGRQYVSKS